MNGQLHELRVARGRKGRRDGRRGEWLAALLLMCKGYQILGFRLRTRHGEIDILAKRFRTLALVEVKRRPTIAQALGALGPIQRERLMRAGRSLVDHRPSLRQLNLRVQLIALAPRRFPRHVSNIFLGRDE